MRRHRPGKQCSLLLSRQSWSPAEPSDPRAVEPLCLEKSSASAVPRWSLRQTFHHCQREEAAGADHCPWERHRAAPGLYQDTGRGHSTKPTCCWDPQRLCCASPQGHLCSKGNALCCSVLLLSGVRKLSQEEQHRCSCASLGLLRGVVQGWLLTSQTHRTAALMGS